MKRQHLRCVIEADAFPIKNAQRHYKVFIKINDKVVSKFVASDPAHQLITHLIYETFKKRRILSLLPITHNKQLQLPLQGE
jgi:hypothetical protein